MSRGTVMSINGFGVRTQDLKLHASYEKIRDILPSEFLKKHFPSVAANAKKEDAEPEEVDELLNGMFEGDDDYLRVCMLPDGGPIEYFGSYEHDCWWYIPAKMPWETGSGWPQTEAEAVGLLYSTLEKVCDISRSGFQELVERVQDEWED